MRLLVTLILDVSLNSFAAFKTNDQLYNWRNDNQEGKTELKRSTSLCSIHKKYRCLVCILQSRRSMISDVETLKKYAREGSVIRHYLEPSIKAPKSFYSVIPECVERPESKKVQIFAFFLL